MSDEQKSIFGKALDFVRDPIGIKAALEKATPQTGSVPQEKPKVTPEQSKELRQKFGLQEEETLTEAPRVKMVKLRIRGGKVQRRKKVSNVPGMTMRGGKLTRMSAAERRRRKMGQRKGKLKRRAKLQRALQKRKRSLQKRKRLGY